MLFLLFYQLYEDRLFRIDPRLEKLRDLKRLGRGYTNFDHFRNRFLFATRNNPTFDGTGNNDQVQYFEDDDF